MKNISLTLTEQDVQHIIDALIFISCVDACYDTEHDDKYHENNLNRLEIAKNIKEQSKLDCTQSVYLFEWGGENEDQKEVDFIKESFNIRIEQ